MHMGVKRWSHLVQSFQGKGERHVYNYQECNVNFVRDGTIHSLPYSLKIVLVSLCMLPSGLTKGNTAN